MTAVNGSLAGKQNPLFSVVRPANGEYTFDEVAGGIRAQGGPTISATDLWQLRKASWLAALREGAAPRAGGALPASRRGRRCGLDPGRYDVLGRIHAQNLNTARRRTAAAVEDADDIAPFLLGRWGRRCCRPTVPVP
jgi:hypothetical protein